MRGRDAAGDGQAFRLGGADKIEPARGGDLADVDRCAGFLDEHEVACDRHRFRDRGRRGKAKPRRHLAIGRNRASGQPFVLGMSDNGKAERRGVGQDAAHDAGIGDARASGGDRARARLLHQADLGKLCAGQALGRGGEWVNP